MKIRGGDLVRSNKVTALERVYDYLADNPSATNRDVADDLDINYDVVKAYINRLKVKGLIEVKFEGTTRVCEIVKEYPTSMPRKPKTYKQEVYYELVEGYRQDFRECMTFDERLKVGREIRIILADM